MLLARTLEGLALASDGAEQRNYTQQLYKLYPQLVPFTDLTMSFRLKVAGNPNKMGEEILDELRSSRMDFTEDKNVPAVTLSFTPQGEALDINYSVHSGEQLIQGTLRVEQHEMDGAGKLLAYRLFNIQKTKTGERPPAVPEPAKGVTKNEEKAV